MALTFAWQQPVDDHAYENNQAGLNETRYQLSMDVDEADEPEAIKRVLGFPKGVDSTTKKIIRQLPMSHPRFPHLYASKEALRSYKFVAKADDGNGPRAQYLKTRITVDFMGLPYTVLSDTATTYEWQRYVSRQPVTTVENIQIPRGRFKFFAGTPGGQTTIEQGRTIRFPKTDLVWTWHHVPEAMIYQDVYGTLSANVLAALGTVNQYWFPSLVQSSTVSGVTVPPNVTGYAPGTLLFLNATPKEQTAPCSPADLGFVDPGLPARVYTVELRFLLIDPPVEAAYGYRGHNLFPVRAEAASTNNFYMASGPDSAGANMGNASGTFTYPKSDFNKIFQSP